MKPNSHRLMSAPAVFACLVLAAADPGFAQDAQTLRSRGLAATCAHCHGTEGRASAGAAIPGLAGMPAPYLAEQMKAFKSGARAGTVMPQLAKGYSDAQIDLLSTWFAKAGAAPQQ